MEINVNGVQITLTKEQLEEINKQVSKPKDWRSRLVDTKNNRFWYLGTSETMSVEVDNFDWGSDSQKPEFAFKYQAQAQIIADKVNLMVEMHNFAHAMNDGWIPDWKNDTQYKFGVLMNEGGLIIDYFRSYNPFVFSISVKSQEIAKQMLDEFGERIKEVCNTQY